MKFLIRGLIAAMGIFRRSSSQLGLNVYETLCDLNCWGMACHLDFPLDLGIDCGKGYYSSFIFAVGRGHAQTSISTAGSG